jgi:cysteinyl-tRNA synthetase
MLMLTNTQSGKKEVFKSLNKKKILMYVCGITPYDRTHIGHGRCYVTFDVLYRVLKFIGYNVVYCRNFTDIDDKLINKAVQQFNDASRYPEIAKKNIDNYHKKMKVLNCLSPDYEPRVTDNIPEIIQFIQELIDTNNAYVIDGDVYFSIASFDKYGALSGNDVANLRAGQRVNVRTNKKDPLDFALWKSEKEETFWQSPWGWGRPGWHIECSVLAKKYLGTQIDIHGGGLDLVFPHHENEQAQSWGLHQVPFVKYWVHNGFVRLDKEKMSKSLGNIISLKDLFNYVDPMILRFYFLNHHYRAPLDFVEQELESITKAYKKLCNLFADVIADDMNIDSALLQQNLITKKMLSFLFDDLNTQGMFSVIFEHAKAIAQDKQLKKNIKLFVQQVLGITLQPIQEKKMVLSVCTQELIAKREKARKDKNWALADELRDKLQAMGIEVQDKKTK